MKWKLTYPNPAVPKPWVVEYFPCFDTVTYIIHCLYRQYTILWYSKDSRVVRWSLSFVRVRRSLRIMNFTGDIVETGDDRRTWVLFLDFSKNNLERPKMYYKIPGKQNGTEAGPYCNSSLLCCITRIPANASSDRYRCLFKSRNREKILISIPLLHGVPRS